MTNPQKVAWNRGKVVGKKPPLTPDEVSLIRLLLRQDSRTQPAAVRDLALFNVALDTCFRGSDLVRLRVADVATQLGVRVAILNGYTTVGIPVTKAVG